MLLVVDVGNTNIVIGLYQGEDLLDSWRIVTLKDRTSDEYGLILDQLFNHNGLSLEDIDDVIIASVVPPLMQTLYNTSVRYLGIKPIIVDSDLNIGMEILYDNPKEVGADRLVNGVGAYKKYGGPLIIVDIGTAITFDVISEKGEYLGGAISPGIKISTDALFMRTSKLPKVEIQEPNRVIGKNTIESIQAGVVYGYIGMIDSILDRMKNEMAKDLEVRVEDIKVIGTGGFSKLIAKESKNIDLIDKMITLDGLKIIYDINCEGKNDL